MSFTYVCEDVDTEGCGIVYEDGYNIIYCTGLNSQINTLKFATQLLECKDSWNKRGLNLKGI